MLTISRRLMIVAALLLVAPALAEERVIRIGVMGDMSGFASQVGGPGAVLAARMAVQDHAGTAAGMPIEVVEADMQNKPDIAAQIARRWFDVEGVDEHLSALDPANFRRMIQEAVTAFPNFEVVATTLRHARTASVNDWGAICWAGGEFHLAPNREWLEIWDRIGGGDSFASGLIYGFLTERGAQWAVECGAAHGALAMTTPGDTSMVTLPEVERVMKGGTARVAR